MRKSSLKPAVRQGAGAVNYLLTMGRGAPPIKAEFGKKLANRENICYTFAEFGGCRVGKSPPTNTAESGVFCIEKVKKQHFLTKSLQMSLSFYERGVKYGK